MPLPHRQRARDVPGLAARLVAAELIDGVLRRRQPLDEQLETSQGNAGFLALNRLSKEQVPVFRTAAAFESGGRSFAPGAFLVPAQSKARTILEDLASTASLPVFAVDTAPPGARVWRVPT